MHPGVSQALAAGTLPGSGIAGGIRISRYQAVGVRLRLFDENLLRHASYPRPAFAASHTPTSGLLRRGSTAYGGTFSLPLTTSSGSNAPVSLRTSLMSLRSR